MDIVAEGVETEFEANTMAKLGCTELQGFYFSRPIDADKMVELLKSYSPKRTAPWLAQASRVDDPGKTAAR